MAHPCPDRQARARLALNRQPGQHGAVPAAANLAAAFAPLVDLVYPPRCPLCGCALASQTGLCPSCWEELEIPGEPHCAACQRPFSREMGEGALCAPCLADPPVHDGIAAGTLYNDASRRLVLAYKHGRKISLAPLLARLMAARLREVDCHWLFVPVPLHRFRLWKRGFNQAVLLATELARAKDAKMLVDALVRRKSTPLLGGLGRSARARALSGAISVTQSHGRIIDGADIVLVDDVLTSGATSDACVRALKRAGARKVRIACFARVLNSR